MAQVILQQVTDLALAMMKAADAADVDAFDKFYKELQNICSSNEKTNNNHPVQWETLADFTQDADESIALYKKALTIAESLKEHQYSASIHYALADRYSELDQAAAGIEHAKQAKVLAAKYDDEDLKNDIEALLEYLSTL